MNYHGVLMAETPANPRRLLFVVSNDFGELSSAIYFTLGQAFGATLALPPRLFAIHGEHLPVRACCYQAAVDVVEIVGRERPDVVMLFSGYLFGVNSIFSVEVLSVLVKELRGRGCHIITTDPFLGLMANLNASTFSDGHPKKAWLMQHFASVAKVMRDITHLYSGNVPTPAGHQGQSFFNEHIIKTGTQGAVAEMRLKNMIALRADRKRWMFVLSMEDYGLQIASHGKQNFDTLLMRRMQETVRAGRQPVLVAPKSCLEAVGANAEAAHSAILLPFCHYDLFQGLALEAEYSFYWNIFSNSILARGASGLPVIFFDSGHIARAIPPLHRLGMEAYYGNAAVDFFPQSSGLDPLLLAEFAAVQKKPMADVLVKFRQLPTPAQVIERVLGA